MDDILTADAMRERLIIAGIRELEAHGLNDFSLRRVAVACEVSCAAPYRHFRDKEHLILEIIGYINHRWSLLREQIGAVFAPDDYRLPVEIGIAHIRFWIANPNFRSVLLLDDPDPDSPRRAERKKIREGMDALLGEYCRLQGFSESRRASVFYRFYSTVYGTVLLLGNRELENNDATLSLVRTELEAILKA